jgi:hypothetical protein
MSVPGFAFDSSAKPYTVTGGKTYAVSAIWCAGAAVSTAAGYQAERSPERGGSSMLPPAP